MCHCRYSEGETTQRRVYTDMTYEFKCMPSLYRTFIQIQYLVLPC
jgi:hypothetical protein